MSNTTTKTQIAKAKSFAFRKDIYLLGIDSEGVKYWLESPSWDCGWYWGFGYVETYTNNNNPAIAKDIDSHSHIDSSFMGKVGNGGEYIHNIYDCPTFAATTFTTNEGWKLSELFKTFYQLKESAGMFGKGGSNITTNPCAETLKNEAWAKHINEVMIPTVTAAILKILTPQ